MLSNRGATAAGFYEPSLDLQVLRGCRNCHAPHPLALKVQPVDKTKCHVCGAPAIEVTETQHVPAVFGGLTPSLVVANACFWLARKIEALIKII